MGALGIMWRVCSFRARVRHWHVVDLLLDLVKKLKILRGTVCCGRGCSCAFSSFRIHDLLNVHTSEYGFGVRSDVAEDVKKNELL